MYQCDLNKLLYHDYNKEDLGRLLPCAVACFLRFGGKIRRRYDDYDPTDEDDTWVDNGCKMILTVILSKCGALGVILTWTISFNKEIVAGDDKHKE